MQAAGVALDNILEEIATYGSQQAEPLTGKTRDRNKVFDAAAATAHAISRLVLGHALTHGLGDVAAQVHVTPSELGQSRLSRRVQLMRQVHAAASSIVTEFADSALTPAMLTDFAASIDAAEAVLTAPRSHIINRRVATANVARSVAKLEQHLRYTMDPLMELHRATDPEGYELYRAARLVIDLPGQPAKEPEPAATASSNQAATQQLAA